MKELNDLFIEMQENIDNIQLLDPVYVIKYSNRANVTLSKIKNLINNSFSLTKDYDKLFKEIHKEDRRLGSVYPSLMSAEAVYTKGGWISVK